MKNGSSRTRVVMAAVGIVAWAATGCVASAQGAGQPFNTGAPPGLGLEHGALLFHGNYCGPGNRSRLPPIDALDRACMHHDACSPNADSGRLASCACDARLRYEATLVANNPRQPDDLRALAGTVAVGAGLLPCQR